MKKIISCLLLVLLLTLCFSSCVQTPEPEPKPEQTPEPIHQCKHTCEYCGKCLDSACTDAKCESKCTEIHTVAQFHGMYNPVNGVYMELLQLLYSDGTTVIYQARTGSSSSNKSEYYGSWTKSGNNYAIQIKKRLPDGKTSEADKVDYENNYTTEAGLNSDAVYMLEIIAFNKPSPAFMRKAQSVTVTSVTDWLNARYENRDLSSAILLSEGNDAKYNPETVTTLENSPLKGKKILQLGSSVTFGQDTGISFVEYLDKHNDCVSVKEAKSGTTLVDNGATSYVSRLKTVDTEQKFDLFICQLSTNDATSNCPLGAISENGEFDTSTVCGALEYIIDYVKTTWNCPIVFYTNSYYKNEAYKNMVTALKQIAEKHKIVVLDLYTDTTFNNITTEQRFLYMIDYIHPTKAGYLQWWIPKFEECIYKIFE